jgi:hypothetical protein
MASEALQRPARPSLALSANAHPGPHRLCIAGKTDRLGAGPDDFSTADSVPGQLGWRVALGGLAQPLDGLAEEA